MKTFDPMWLPLVALVLTFVRSTGLPAQQLEPPQPAPSVDANHETAEGTLVTPSGSISPATVPGDPNVWDRQHVVTNPRGQMLHTWEGSTTEDGYTFRREHRFTDPDGNLLRQHEWSTSGTDPYNYRREKTITLRDGRTIRHTQTRTWDGTSGTMQRTFLGPNGQTRQSERPWVPEFYLADDPQASPQEQLPDRRFAARPVGGAPPPAASLPDKRTSFGRFFGKLFGSSGKTFRGSRPAPTQRPGFTVGSGGHLGQQRNRHGLSKKPPGQLFSETHRSLARRPSVGSMRPKPRGGKSAGPSKPAARPPSVSRPGNGSMK